MIRYSLIIGLFIITSCTEKFEIQKSEAGNKLVVEGQIVNYNSGSCYSYIRLTKSKLGVNVTDHDAFFTHDSLTYINDAIVIVRDDFGNIDTFKKEPEKYPYIWYDQDSVSHIDSSENYYYQRGYYRVNKLIPQENRTYYLTVQSEGKEYHASCFMPHLPKMDSISFVNEANYKGENGYTPYLYFKDPPQEKNYYLFIGNTGNTYWGYTVLDDKLIDPDVKGVNIFKGVTNEYWMSAFRFKGPYHYEVHSVTKEAYDFYNTLSKLYVNDGGNYKPAPASPISNIDNGALGFFRASSVHVFDGIIQ